MSCFYFLPSLVSNKVHWKGSDTWCSIEAAGKDVEGEEEEEEEVEDQEEEEEDEAVEQEQEKKVELSHPSVTVLPDLLEFERCERPGAHGEGDKCSSGSTLQALSHGPSRFPHRKGSGMGLAEGLEK